MKFKWIKVLQGTVGKSVGLGDQTVPNLCQVHTMLPLMPGALLTSFLQSAGSGSHAQRFISGISSWWHTSALSGKVPFQEKKLTRVEECLRQHCPTSDTLSNSSWRLEEGEDFHTVHWAAVSLARSKPTLDHSTALRCWVCEHPSQKHRF